MSVLPGRLPDADLDLAGGGDGAAELVGGFEHGAPGPVTAELGDAARAGGAARAGAPNPGGRGPSPADAGALVSVACKSASSRSCRAMCRSTSCT